MSEMLYARFGDHDPLTDGQYTPFINLRAFNNDLIERGIVGLYEAIPGNPYGITAPDFQGNNYISVYYGTDVETPTKGLTAEELAWLNDRFIARWSDGVLNDKTIHAEHVPGEIDMSGPTED